MKQLGTTVSPSGLWCGICARRCRDGVKNGPRLRLSLCEELWRPHQSLAMPVDDSERADLEAKEKRSDSGDCGRPLSIQSDVMDP